ncbi:hypothetical protein MTO96_038598 [Rhipicephalus appendiculatus]
MALVFECSLFVALVAANLALGLYFSVRNAPSRRTDAGARKLEVFLGSRALRYLPLAASSVASLVSSTGLIGFPAHFYAYGWHVLWISLAPLLLFPVATQLFVPLLYKLGVTSIFEYLRLRFNAGISLTACIIYILLTILPYYINTYLVHVPGFLGLFLAGVVCASTSTISSTINSQATILYVDVISLHFKNADQHVVWITRCTALILGVMMTTFSTVCVYMGSLTRALLMVYSSITAPFVGLCLLGTLFPFVHSKGAGVATALTAAFQLWHMTHTLRTGRTPPRMPVSLDYCPGNHTPNTISSNTSNVLEIRFGGVIQSSSGHVAPVLA